MNSFILRALASICTLSTFACTTTSHKVSPYRSMTVAKVDLAKFMGPWYVHGHVPFIVDHDSSNQIESYELKADGTIATTFTFDRDGQKHVMHPVGWVVDQETNSHWKMRVFWPFAGDYLIVRLKDDYSMTVVSVPSRDLVWIMTRTPHLADADYDKIVQDLKQDGYDVTNLRRVPQFNANI